MIVRTALKLGCSLALALATPALAQTDDLAAALALPVVSQMAGARDVQRFAWVENRAGARNLWVADAGQKARQLTHYAEDDGMMLYDLALSPDGKRLAFVRGGDDEFPDGRIPNTASAAYPPGQQVFVVGDNGVDPTPIGDGHLPVFSPDGTRIAFTRRGEIWLWQSGKPARIASFAGEATDLKWTPDGKRLTFVDNRDDHAFVAFLDVDAPKLTYMEPALGYSAEPALSPDASQIAYIQYRDPPAGAAPDGGPYWSIRVADTATGKAHTVWTAPQGMGGRYAGTRQHNLYWSKQGKLLFPWERSGFLQVYAIDADKGGEPKELTPGKFEVETFVLGADDVLTFAANADETDRRHLWQVPASGGAAKRITNGKGSESLPLFAGGLLAGIATDASHPGHPVVAKGLSPLSDAAELKGAIEPEAVTYQAEDGVTVHAQLFRGKGKGPRPALIFVHGGPRRQMLLGFHPSQYYSNAYIMNQALAAHGYSVLSVNYRSGTGYGQAFREAPNIARDGASEYRDVLAGGRWLAAQKDVAPEKIGIWGGSWGGYLTALALARNSDLFKAGADFHGVHTMLKNVDNNIAPELQLAVRQKQWDSSPMGSIDKWRSPVLLIHGDDDRNVDFGQSLLLARELSARRIPFEELVFPNERHEFFRYTDWLAAYRRATAFFDGHLK
ncbi:S9 family peptidase [Sphingomonas sp. R-74633]|uniref:S9 family peptidase n=1 Tax=Sphingomonas sp. R-74633 TaxID=2751188 RepID=UPI0015D1FB71|nr:alpha/beta fold hydrolase [Sphingomonas sp. R-74633]NYT42178.1 S9 family peptidase [Sphingomonas sp. R-74633]